MDIKKNLAFVGLHTETELRKYLRKEASESEFISTLLKEISPKENLNPIFGGKYLRAAFVYNSYLMFGGKQKDEIFKICGAIELIHSYLLVHDDVMDKAIVRRNVKTMHKVFEDHYLSINNNKLNAEYFGISQAISIGDALCHLGLQLITESKFATAKKLKTLNKVNRSIIDVAYGQMWDSFPSIKNFSMEEVLKIYLFKTGYYTYEMPIVCGAILAGAKKKQIEILMDYSAAAGIAFQIIDDIVDLFGEDNGKGVGKDLKEGKQTILIKIALENSTPKQKIFIKKFSIRILFPIILLSSTVNVSTTFL